MKDNYDTANEERLLNKLHANNIYLLMCVSLNFSLNFQIFLKINNYRGGNGVRGKGVCCGGNAPPERWAGKNIK